MAKVVVLYRKPVDPVAFDRYYVETHVPLAKKIVGLQRYAVSAGPVVTPVGPSAYQLVATLEFDSMGALQQGMGSPEGLAAAADLPNFATAGVELLIFDTKDV